MRVIGGQTWSGRERVGDAGRKSKGEKNIAAVKDLRQLQLCQQFLAVGLALGTTIAVTVPPIPATAQMMQKDGWSGSKKLEKMFSVQASHRAMSQA